MRYSIFLYILLIAPLLTIAGCGDEKPVTDDDVDPEPAQSFELAPRARPTMPPPVEKQADKASGILDERKTGELAHDGTGLIMVISAIDKDDFNQSLSLIAQETNSEQYQALESSLRYLKHNNGWVQGKDDRLMQLVDGKTGEEVIEMAVNLAGN